MNLTKITIDESLQYFPSKGIDNASYYTFSPSSRGKGWEDITYFTSRKKLSYTNRDGDHDSWVYVLSNPAQPGILKIGYTSNTPEERARQLSNATGVALPYVVEYAYSCWNGLELEKDIHERLNEYRLSKQREFFQVDLDEVKEIIGEIGESYI
jgi:hypothetical protein|tara:strand:- start:140 stop:601 length:462 start_codon:yes stop_codon:yes gene_type:complete